MLGATSTARPRLVVTDGDLAGQVIPIDHGDVIVGRDSQCGIVLAVACVSRNHARITHDVAGTWVDDLRTAAGTAVNGLRIHEPTLLRAGDEVRFGEVTAVYEAPPRRGRAARIMA